MIGSHDSYTYLKSTSCIFNHCTRLWRTQSISLDEQYKIGVRFFDIRVCQEVLSWRVCHGCVELRQKFSTVESICRMMSDKYPEAIFRIVLEKGPCTFFVDDVLHPISSITETLCDRFPNLWRVDIKSTRNWMGGVCNNNQKLYDRGYKFALVDTWVTPAYELHGNVTWKNFYKANLRMDAEKINDKLSFFHDDMEWRKMAISKDELYLLDFVNLGR